MAKVKTIIVVVHAKFDTKRHAMCAALMDKLRPQCEEHGVALLLHENEKYRDVNGALPSTLEALGRGLGIAQLGVPTEPYTHLTLMWDDAILTPHFVEVLLNIIAARPNDVLCMLSNSNAAREVYAGEPMWYSECGGSLAFAGTMTIEMWREHLRWRDQELDVPVPIDDGINLWCMLTNRLVHKPLPSPCEHDTTLESLGGNGWQDKDPRARILRHAQVWEPERDLRGADWSTEPVHLPRTFANQHWNMVNFVKRTCWDIEAMYRWARHGKPVSETPHVFIVTPIYGEQAIVLEKTKPSRIAVARDLMDHGVGVSFQRMVGDSLVQRMRQRAVHQFMKSEATHMLFWDADMEATDAACVRKMLASGHDVVAGACPFKNDTGRVVCNLVPGSLEDDIQAPHGCIAVQDIGTGFMLISRKAVATLMQRHKELLHWSRSDFDRDEPLWALFDTGIVDGVYLSEDYMFCRLWQRAGGKVYVHVPSTFKHWGLHGFEGSFAESFGLEIAQPTELM